MSYFSKRKLCRNGDKKMVSGVCAGVADYTGVHTDIVRVVSVIALLMMPMVTGIAYLLAVILLPEVTALNRYKD